MEYRQCLPPKARLRWCRCVTTCSATFSRRGVQSMPPLQCHAPSGRISAIAQPHSRRHRSQENPAAIPDQISASATPSNSEDLSCASERTPDLHPKAGLDEKETRLCTSRRYICRPQTDPRVLPQSLQAHIPPRMLPSVAGCLREGARRLDTASRHPPARCRLVYTLAAYSAFCDLPFSLVCERDVVPPHHLCRQKSLALHTLLCRQRRSTDVSGPRHRSSTSELFQSR
mmetsp:Transcript_30711/g.77647  ORF Transcript_30711/g.77647 Transcript_30711/m.77647 type:complete len:229 (+) Transcript_30711:101-787(+)